jgi:hypothetical protein
MCDTETLTKDMYKEKGQEKKQEFKLLYEQGDFPIMGMDLMKRINFKIATFLFLIGFFIFSDVFINKLLSKEYHEMGCPTSQGTMVQLLLLVVSYILIDLLAQGGVI